LAQTHLWDLLTNASMRLDLFKPLSFSPSTTRRYLTVVLLRRNCPPPTHGPATPSPPPTPRGRQSPLSGPCGMSLLLLPTFSPVDKCLFVIFFFFFFFFYVSYWMIFNLLFVRTTGTIPHWFFLANFFFLFLFYEVPHRFFPFALFFFYFIVFLMGVC